MFYEEEDSWVSEFWFRLFASVLLFSCSYWRVSLSTFRPSSSLDPPSTSCQSFGAPPCIGPQYSECTVDEVVVRVTGCTAADLLTPKVTVAEVADPSKRLVVAS